MRNRKCTKPKRLLSFFLAVLVAVSILPMSWLQASAATEKHPDAVTITVTDGNGKALSIIRLSRRQMLKIQYPEL